MSKAAQKIIFVTGASRSGTTLLSFILRNHSNVFGLKELHFFGETWDPRRGQADELTEDQLVSSLATLFARQRKGIISGKPDSEDRSHAASLYAELIKENPSGVDPARAYLRAVANLSADAGKQIPCEQTPRNIFYAGALLDAYPEARIVHVLRDPRAVMASQKMRWQRRKLAKDENALSRYDSLRAWVNYHPYTVSRMWCRATEIAFGLKEHPRFNVVHFEDLLQQPEETVRKICEHVSIKFEPQMLDVGHVNSSHQSAVGGARKGLRTEAIDTWRNTLLPGETGIAERLCGPLMESAGYSFPDSGPQSGANETRYRLTYLLHLLAVVLVNPRRAWIQARALIGRSLPPQPGTQS